MAWLELILGLIALAGGIMTMLRAANVPVPDLYSERRALYGLVVGVAGALLLLLGAIQLVVGIFR